MGKFQNLKGKRFGRLTVIDLCDRNNGYVLWLCKCDCGNTTKVKSSKLLQGRTKSCGCLKKDNNKENANYYNIKHKRLYNIWNKMKERCCNEKNSAYPNYGGRGITICKEWAKSFQAFMSWAIANGYNDNLTIDRVDNNGNYEPNNCRWATREEQANNTRANRLLSYNGKTMTLSEWAKELNVYKTTLYRRIDKYKDNLDLIFYKGDKRYGKRN